MIIVSNKLFPATRMHGYIYLWTFFSKWGNKQPGMHTAAITDSTGAAPTLGIWTPYHYRYHSTLHKACDQAWS